MDRHNVVEYEMKRFYCHSCQHTSLINLRDRLICPHCHSSNIQDALSYQARLKRNPSGQAQSSRNTHQQLVTEPVIPRNSYNPQREIPRPGINTDQVHHGNSRRSDQHTHKEPTQVSHNTQPTRQSHPQTRATYQPSEEAKSHPYNTRNRSRDPRQPQSRHSQANARSSEPRGYNPFSDWFNLGRPQGQRPRARNAPMFEMPNLFSIFDDSAFLSAGGMMNDIMSTLNRSFFNPTRSMFLISRFMDDFGMNPLDVRSFLIETQDMGFDDIGDLLSGLASRHPEGPRPANEQRIRNLQDIRVTSAMINDQPSCAVCQENFKVAEFVKKLACNHLFHNDCITPWLRVNDTCPLCRQPV